MKTEDGNNSKDIKAFLESINLSQYQKHKDFHIFKFTDHIDELPKKVSSQKYGFFRIISTKNHEADIRINERRFNAFNEHVSFIVPEQRVSVDTQRIDKNGSGYMLLFTPDFLRFTFSTFDLFQKFPFFNLNNSPVYFIKEARKDFFINHLEKIYNYFIEFNSDNLEIIRSYVIIMLFEAKKLFFNHKVESVANSRAEELTLQFENLIKQTKQKKRI